jgi:SET domain-containing protein
MTDCVELRSSSIHACGAFAATSIRVGQRVLEYTGQRITKAEAQVRCEAGNYFIFNLNKKWDLDGNVPTNPARFINHSCAPNCDAEQEGNRIWIVARRDIQPGEELTFNYGYSLEDYIDNPCRCGASECVGYIVAEELFNEVRARHSQPAAASAQR